MSKKSTLILTVAVLGLLSAGAMWFMTNQMPFGYKGGVMMNDVLVERTMPSVGAGTVGMRDTKEMGMTTSNIAPYPYYPPTYGGDALNVTDRSVQKFSSQTFVVTNVNDYLQKTKEYLASIGGIVLTYNQGTSNRSSYGYLTVKVPIDKFEQATTEVSKDVKKVIDESINIQDVTGQTVNIAEQIQSLKDSKAVQEAALEDAKSAAEKQKIQIEINRLDRQIKLMEDNQQVVLDQVDYATMSISISDKESYFNGSTRSLWDVLQQAWWSLKDTAIGLISFLIWVAVYAIIWIPVLLLARWIWGKVRPAAKNSTSK
jgi:hypothetical protein